jgi:flagellar protein FliS
METKILTAAPEDLTIIVFDILIVAATKAIDRLNTEPGDIQAIHNALIKSQNAVALLMGSLNMEIGGDLARNLFRIYAHWHRELVLANMQKKAERIEAVLPTIKEFRETWLEANRRRRAELMPAPAAPPRDGGFLAVG